MMIFPDPDAELLLFTDASASGYSIILTQVRVWDAALPVDEQKHELIVCKGGLFKHAEMKWTVVEKEAFPIIKACHDLDYLLLRPKDFASIVITRTWRTSSRQMWNSRSI
ncbi:hypothetical protein PC128_g11542 [Phytophthora cactorum]|nr:hypothetical protein PC128_g11542 [Phytophthora cactorum]